MNCSISKDALDILTQESPDRQVAVKLYELCDNPVTLYVFSEWEARDLVLYDQILYTLRQRFEWEDANPARAWSWRWLGILGPAKKFGSDYPGS